MTDFYKNKPKRAVWKEKMFPVGLPYEDISVVRDWNFQIRRVINKYTNM